MEVVHRKEPEGEKVIPEYQQRVIEECQELNIKLENLRKFLNTDFFNSQDEDTKGDLIHQELVMTAYKTVLLVRISKFK